MNTAKSSAPGNAPASGNWHHIMGVSVVCGFATLWAWMGAGALHQGTMVFRGTAILLSVILLGARVATSRRNRSGPVDRRLLWFTIVGEVVAMWIMGAALGHWNRSDLLLPGLAIIVGLHFFSDGQGGRDTSL